MTQEEKQLLLKDICARLPYGVKCKDQCGDYIYVNIYNANIEHLVDQIVSGVIQMVLRSLSSMTDEEEKEYRTINYYEGLFPRNEDALDYVLKHHFDFRGLISMGLALEVPKEMYNS